MRERALHMEATNNNADSGTHQAFAELYARERQNCTACPLYVRASKMDEKKSAGVDP